MKRSLTILAGVVLGAMLIGSCVTGDGEATTSANAQAKSSQQPIMIVNGEKVYASEVIAFPVMRGALRQYIYRIGLAQEGTAEGITVDEQKLADLIEGEKNFAKGRNQTWHEYLAEMNKTEEELIDEKRADLIFDGLVAADTDTSEEALRKFWDENKEDTINRYIEEYFLPESERASLTFEDCRDFVYERVLQREYFPKADALFKRLFYDATLEILCFDTEAGAKHHENMILYDVVEQEKRKSQEAQEASAALLDSTSEE